MELQEVDVIIEKDGQVRIEVRGVKGPSCLDLTRGLEEALGALKGLQESLRPPSDLGPRPVTILGRDSLVRYESPVSILRLT